MFEENSHTPAETLAGGDWPEAEYEMVDSMGLYTRDVRKQTLLNGLAAEVALAKTIEGGIVAEAVLVGRQQARDEAQGIVYQSLADRIAEVRHRLGPTSPKGIATAEKAAVNDEEFTWYLMRRFPEHRVDDAELEVLKDQGLLARDEFIRANTPLAMNMAARMRCRAPLQDRIQWANLGLIRAVDKFDYRRGNKFSTHAAWWIRQALSRENDTLTRFIRLPGNMMNEVVKVDRAEKALLATDTEKPTDEQIAEQTGFPLETVKRSRPLIKDALHLDGLLHEYDEMREDAFSALGVGAEQSAEREFEQQERARLLKEVLATTLSPQDIELLYIAYCSPHYLDAEARERGMSRRQAQSLVQRITARLGSTPAIRKQLQELRKNIA